MPRYLMKVAPDQDLYVEWSTVVDNITWAGTREELLVFARSERWKGDVEERIARTDREGTSAMFFDEPPQEGSWDDAQLLVTNDSERDGYFWLDRADLAAYAMGDSTVLQPIPEDD